MAALQRWVLGLVTICLEEVCWIMHHFAFSFFSFLRTFSCSLNNNNDDDDDDDDDDNNEEDEEEEEEEEGGGGGGA